MNLGRAQLNMEKNKPILIKKVDSVKHHYAILILRIFKLLFTLLII